VVSKTKMAVAAVLMLCVSSAAYAGGSRNDADPSGGYPVGPMGQIFEGVNPALHPAIFGRSEATYDYAGFPHRAARPHKRAKNR
jgi:hypothetical protein